MSASSDTPGVPEVILTSTYDAVGSRLGVADNLGTSISSAYNARNQLISRLWEVEGQAARFDFQYDGRGDRIDTRRYADLLAQDLVGHSTASRDANGRLLNLTHRDPLDAILAQYDYTYDAAGQLTQWSHHGETIDFTHDATGQLTAAASDGSLPDENYTYDENGNRTLAGYETGPGNRLLSDGTYNYQYDAEGNLVLKTEIATGAYTTYEWDHRNRLIRVAEFSAGGILLSEVSYTYDSLDRRIARTENGTSTHFVYDGQHIWADFDGQGHTLARYLYGDRIDELLARWRADDGLAFYLTDHLGTVRDIVDASGLLINHIAYDSFGRILTETNPHDADRFRFTAREWDPAISLYHYRARWYDASTGRFVSVDPIGFAAGDANLYRYVGNGPVGFFDPTGTRQSAPPRTGNTEHSIVLASSSNITTAARATEATSKVVQNGFLVKARGAALTTIIYASAGGVIIGFLTAPIWLGSLTGVSFPSGGVGPEPTNIWWELSQGDHSVIASMSLPAKAPRAAESSPGGASEPPPVLPIVPTIDSSPLGGDDDECDEQAAAAYASASLWRVTPSTDVHMAYQIRVAGPFEYLVRGGGKKAQIDGVMRCTILEAKHIEKQRSPYIPTSEAPEFIKQLELVRITNFLGKVKAIINDPSVPMIDIQIITNHPISLAFFSALLNQENVPGEAIYIP